MHLLFVEKQTPEQILKEYPELEEYLQYPAHYTYMQEVANLNLSAYWKNVGYALFVHSRRRGFRVGRL